MTRKPDPAKLPTGVYASGKSHFQYRLPLPRDPDTGKRRQEVRGGFLTPEDAFLARARRLAELGRGAVVDGHPAPLDHTRTVREYVTAFLDAHALNVDPPTIYTYRATVRLHLFPLLGDVRLRDLTPERVRAWVAQVARTTSANTARQARARLVQALNQALADGLVERNVAQIVKAPRHTPRPVVVLDTEQIGRLLPVLDEDEHAACWYLALLAQLRPGELAGLRWADLDLDRALVHVRNTRSRGEHGGWVVGDGAKTDAGVRTIPVPPVCVDTLREHRRRQVALRLALPPGVWHDHALVFPGRHGQVLNNATLERRVSRLCETAGVPRITPHGLRGSGATLLSALGVDPKTISQRLGHTDVRMTLNRYVHPSASAQVAASERLDAALRDLRRDQREAR